MINFIGRERELESLEREYQRDSSFVVIYGRCRVGKTTLIKEFIKSKCALYFLATEEIESRNRKRFSESLAEFTGLSYLKSGRFDYWEDMFRIFISHNKGQKKILVIDEFQYLVNANKAFTSVFQRICDEVLKDSNIMVILCGSYISMMVTEVLSYSSPLYGRRTAQIKLAPLKFLEIRDAFTQIDFKKLVEIYAVTGGVPKYLDFFINNNDFYDNIKNEILSKNGFLYEEPVFLLEKEVRESMTYFSIMQTIADGNHKLSKIAGNLEVPVTSITPYIKTLKELGLVEKRIPVTEKKPEKSRKGLYYISDNFVEFWFKFVSPYKGQLELGNIKYVTDKLSVNFTDSHVSFVFEDICRELVYMLSKKMNIEISKVGSYWDSSCEVDIVALDYENNKVLIGECKYNKKPVRDNVFYSLKEKAEKIKAFEGYERTYVLFSVSGFDERTIQVSNKRNDLVLVDKGKIVS